MNSEETTQGSKEAKLSQSEEYPTFSDLEKKLAERDGSEIRVPNYKKTGTLLVLTPEKVLNSAKKAQSVIFAERYKGYIPTQLISRYFAMLQLRDYLSLDDIEMERRKIESLINAEIPPFRNPHQMGDLLLKTSDAPPGPFPVDDYIIEFGSDNFIANRSFRAMDRKKRNLVGATLFPQPLANIKSFIRNTMVNGKIDPDFLRHVQNYAESQFGSVGMNEDGVRVLQERRAEVVVSLEKAFADVSPKEKEYKELDKNTFQIDEWFQVTKGDHLWYLQYSMEDRGWLADQLTLLLEGSITNKKDAASIYKMLLPLRNELPNPSMLLDQSRFRGKYNTVLAKINDGTLNDVSGNDLKLDDDLAKNFLKKVESAINALNMFEDKTARMFLFGTVEDVYALVGLSPSVKSSPKMTAFIEEKRIKVLNGMTDHRIKELVVSSEPDSLTLRSGRGYQQELRDRLKATGIMGDLLKRK